MFLSSQEANETKPKILPFSAFTSGVLKEEPLVNCFPCYILCKKIAALNIKVILITNRTLPIWKDYLLVFEEKANSLEYNLWQG